MVVSILQTFASLIIIKKSKQTLHIFQWMEKKQDGGFVFRSGRAEEREVRRFDDHNNKTMEALYAKIRADIQREDKGTGGAGNRTQILLR